MIGVLHVQTSTLYVVWPFSRVVDSTDAFRFSFPPILSSFFFFFFFDQSETDLSSLHLHLCCSHTVSNL